MIPRYVVADPAEIPPAPDTVRAAYILKDKLIEQIIKSGNKIDK